MTRFRGLLLLALALTLGVIALGAYVRLTDAGLGCPDWPGCYGRLASLPESAEEIAAARAQDPRGAYDAGKAAREMLHRYAAGALGLLVLLLAALGWSGRAPRRLRPGLNVLLLLVAGQALLGMWTVTLQLQPLVVVAHLLGGFATLGLLWLLWLPAPAADHRPAVPRSLRRWAAAALAALLVQIALGGWTSANYAALACPDFPTCQGQWWPEEMDFEEAFVLWRGAGIDYEFGVLDGPARTAVHMAHRAGAAAAALLLLLLAFASWRSDDTRLRRGAAAIVLLLAAQLGLGVGNVLLHLPLPVAVAHNVTAALLLLAALAQLRRARAAPRP